MKRQRSQTFNLNLLIMKNLTKLINEINELTPLVNQCNDYAFTYDGGTWPYYIILDGDITIKNQFVYIPQTENFSSAYIFEKRYNTNKIDDFDVNGKKQLLQDLRVNKKAYKKLLK